MTTPVVLAATAKHTATLIFLHGLGDTGQGWAGALSVRPPYVKVICPTAPTMAVSLNAGFRMPSWFDLLTLDESGPEDQEGIRQATSKIHSMIEDEVKRGIAPNRIIIGGFSQGGALALYSSLVYTKKLAGVVSLSGWLPLNKTFPAALKAPTDLPVLQCHGDCDPIVPYKWGQMTSSILKSLLQNHEFKSYKSLGHSSSEEELKDVRSFISRCLPPV